MAKLYMFKILVTSSGIIIGTHDNFSKSSLSLLSSKAINVEFCPVSFALYTFQILLCSQDLKILTWHIKEDTVSDSSECYNCKNLKAKRDLSSPLLLI